MKKYFLNYIFEDVLLFMSFGFILLSPLLILLMINSKENNYVGLFYILFSVMYSIHSYLKFDSELYLRRKEINKKFNALSTEEKEKLLEKV